EDRLGGWVARQGQRIARSRLADGSWLERTDGRARASAEALDVRNHKQSQDANSGEECTGKPERDGDRTVGEGHHVRARGDENAAKHVVRPKNRRGLAVDLRDPSGEVWIGEEED